MESFAAPVAHFFWSFLAPVSIQAALLLLAAGLADRLLPAGWWPELKLAAGSVLMLKLVLPPSWASASAALPAWPALPGFSFAFAGPEFAAAASWRGWAIAAGLLWLAGTLLGLLLLAVRRYRLALVWRAAAPAGAELEALLAAAAARLGMRRAPPLRLAEGLGSPCVFGLLRPRILLPPDLDPRMAEHALLHELAHVRRGDLPLSALLGVLRAFYFFHPLVHLAARRLEGLRELCCDRFVARRLGEERAAYRLTLLAFAARRHGEALAGLSLAGLSLTGLSLTGLAFAGRSSLLERLRALERAERDRPLLRRGLTTLAALLAFGCALPLAPPAEAAAAEVAELIDRPPGCLQLRFLVMERMAAEQRLEKRKKAEGNENEHQP